MKRDKAVWIGLAEVNPIPGSTTLGSDKKGACVNVLIFSSDADEFEKQLTEMLDQLGLKLISLEDVEPFSIRTSNHQVDTALIELAAKVNSHNAIEFGNFHTFPIGEQK
jgi:hypothetical protein